MTYTTPGSSTGHRYHLSPVERCDQRSQWALRIGGSSVPPPRPGDAWSDARRRNRADVLAACGPMACPGEEVAHGIDTDWYHSQQGSDSDGSSRPYLVVLMQLPCHQPTTFPACSPRNCVAVVVSGANVQAVGAALTHAHARAGAPRLVSSLLLLSRSAQAREGRGRVGGESSSIRGRLVGESSSWDLSYSLDIMAGWAYY